MYEILCHAREVRSELVSLVISIVKPQETNIFHDWADLENTIVRLGKHDRVHVILTNQCSWPSNLATLVTALKGKTFIIYLVGPRHITQAITRAERSLAHLCRKERGGHCIRISAMSAPKHSTRRAQGKQVKTLAKFGLSRMNLD